MLEQIIKQSMCSQPEGGEAWGAYGHGRVKSKSSRANLISFYDRVTGHVDKGKVIDVIYPDFSNAFDSSPHDILINKHRRYGLDHTLVS